jgi:hypothetical protein
MLQSDFTAAILDPNAPVPPGMVDPQGRPAGKRFNVYRNNLAASLTDALETGFPVLLKLLGEKSFKTLALIISRAHPPTSRALSQYGDAMPAFLEGFQPLVAYPYLADIARLELAIRRSYHAADADPLNAAGMDPETLMELTPVLAPAAQIVASPYPIHGIWRRNTQTDAPKPQPTAETVMITRPEFDPVPHLLPAGGAAFAGALDGRTTIALALERSIEAEPGIDLAPLLTLFLTSGALTLQKGPDQ